jgi:hypothetical protein
MRGSLDSWIDGDTLGVFENFVKGKIPDIHNDVLKLIWTTYLNTYDRSALMYACDIKYFKAFHERHLNDGLRTCPFKYELMQWHCVDNDYHKLAAWILKNGYTFRNLWGLELYLQDMKCNYDDDVEIPFLEIMIEKYFKSNKKQKL